MVSCNIMGLVCKRSFAVCCPFTVANGRNVVMSHRCRHRQMADAWRYGCTVPAPEVAQLQIRVRLIGTVAIVEGQCQQLDSFNATSACRTSLLYIGDGIKETRLSGQRRRLKGQVENRTFCGEMIHLFFGRTRVSVLEKSSRPCKRGRLPYSWNKTET